MRLTPCARSRTYPPSQTYPIVAGLLPFSTLPITAENSAHTTFQRHPNGSSVRVVTLEQHVRTAALQAQSCVVPKQIQRLSLGRHRHSYGPSSLCFSPRSVLLTLLLGNKFSHAKTDSARSAMLGIAQIRSAPVNGVSRRDTQIV